MPSKLFLAASSIHIQLHLLSTGIREFVRHRVRGDVSEELDERGEGLHGHVRADQGAHEVAAGEREGERCKADARCGGEFLQQGRMLLDACSPRSNSSSSLETEMKRERTG